MFRSVAATSGSAAQKQFACTAAQACRRLSSAVTPASFRSVEGTVRVTARSAIAPAAADSVPSALRTARRAASTSHHDDRHTCLAAHGVSIASLRRHFSPDTTTTTTVHGATSAADAVPPREEVTVRARVERVRGRGKLAFLHLRQPPLESLQAVCVGKELAAQAKLITPESIVDVTGTVARASSPVQSATCQHCELHVTSLRIVSAAATPLPFPYRDANTRLDTRLNHRVMDLRTERMVAVARLVSALGQSFRHELLQRGFMEVHTPKLIAAASEGGSNVFTVDYFGKPAYLAQSPQLYKQMMLMGDAMRVFEIGPVFRAENSLTHRHLTEFVGLDGEMVIHESHTEVLDVLEPVMCAILKTLAEQHGELIDVLWRQQQRAEGGEEEVAGEAQSGVGAGSRRRHALRDVCCEVPQSIMEAFGVQCDTAPSGVAAQAGSTSENGAIGSGAPLAAARTASPAAATAPLDKYHARVSGVSGCRVLRLAFADAAQLLMDGDAGAEVSADSSPSPSSSSSSSSPLPFTDFSLPQERRLGELIKARYGVDLYVVDRFPFEARPFYTMPLDVSDPTGPTRSYDMYLRGEEICSGAQRVDDAALLERQLAAKKVDRATVADYVDAFRYGAWPHGGFGLGLERIALFFLDLEDIRLVSLFPRDPKRITP